MRTKSVDFRRFEQALYAQICANREGFRPAAEVAVMYVEEGIALPACGGCRTGNLYGKSLDETRQYCYNTDCDKSSAWHSRVELLYRFARRAHFIRWCGSVGRAADS